MRDRDASSRFPALFERRARLVRRALTARRLLGGATVGLVVGAVVSAVAWRAGVGAWRWAGGSLAVCGALGGWVFAARRRWSDATVALWLDARLEGREAITTAIELAGSGAAASEALGAAGARALEAAPDARIRPRVLLRRHGVAPFALAVLVAAARLPSPTRVAPLATTAADRVVIADAAALSKAAALTVATPRDAAQRERLAQIAKDAEKLRADLATGLDRKDALDRAARLHDAIAAERLSLGDRAGRAGLEAALSRLEQDAAARPAASALGDHDLERLDRDMERLADAREQKDRKTARSALGEAAEAARGAGASDVGRALDEEREALDRRAARATELRQLADALAQSGAGTADARRALDALDRDPGDQSAQQLADALEKALEGLTDEERARLAERLRRGARSAEDPAASRALAGALATPEGRERLAQSLGDLAREDDAPPEAHGQAALDGAERGASDLARELGGSPAAAGAAIASGPPGTGGAPGGAGSHEDRGTGGHAGKTAPLDVAALRSRAQGRVGVAPGLPGATTGWGPGRAGAVADARGTGALAGAATSEVDGVEHDELPTGYRDQVERYFQP